MKITLSILNEYSLMSMLSSTKSPLSSDMNYYLNNYDVPGLLGLLLRLYCHAFWIQSQTTPTECSVLRKILTEWSPEARWYLVSNTWLNYILNIYCRVSFNLSGDKTTDKIRRANRDGLSAVYWSENVGIVLFMFS